MCNYIYIYIYIYIYLYIIYKDIKGTVVFEQGCWFSSDWQSKKKPGLYLSVNKLNLLDETTSVLQNTKEINRIHYLFQKGTLDI